MQHRKYTAMALGVRLCAVLFALAQGIGQTQARYENTVSWKGVYNAETPLLRSNFLTQEGQTVLLKDWVVTASSYRTVNIQLATDGTESRGALRCQVDSDLITAKVDGESYNVGKTKNYATLTLSTTERGKNLTEATQVAVRVSWIPEGEAAGEPAAWADFVVKLLPREEMNTPQTQPDILRPEGALQISSPEAFAVEERLVVRLTLPQGTDRVVLSYEGDNFPENTCYTVPGRQGIALAESMKITVPAEGQQLVVVLDFSWTAVRQSSFMLSAVAYAEDQDIAATNITVSTDRQALEVETDSAAIVMGANARVTLPIYGDLDGFVWELQQLVQADGETGYEASDALIIETEAVTTDYSTEDAVLTIINEYTHAPAGKYRLTLQRVADGVVLSSFELIIFVCY